MSAINFAFQASFTDVVQTALHTALISSVIAVVPSGSLSSGLSTRLLDPGTLDGSDNLVDNPLDKEPDGTTGIADEVKSVCNAVWTTSVKDAWKAHLIANKSAT